MFRVLIVALLLAGCSLPADPKIEAAVAPVRAAFAKVEAEQAALPPAKDDSERLERLLAVDQAGRQAMWKFDFATLPQPQRTFARIAAESQIKAHDRGNTAALKAMLPAQGWFTKDRFSGAARDAAFLIVQHSDHDRGFMREALARMEPLVATGDVRGETFAMLYDRIALQDIRPQRYGTQMICKNGRWKMGPLEDPQRVDALRKRVGLPDTLAEYEASFASLPACA